MNICVADTPTYVSFDSLDIGDVFTTKKPGRENFVFMKICSITDCTGGVEDELNAVYLDDGDIAYFNEEDLVLPMQADLTVRVKTTK